ncbi:MAG: hypothetical protein J6K75_10255 [Erysipelotrichaceae bacterium]|nr:hypothetical protein [Erysipelotrichaceae bacterium]MBQ7890241.1 hypothetical protein [Erysipelotrichaceae bacterium]
MEIFFYGFFGIIIIAMGMKAYEDYKFYRGSFYTILYSGFIEYYIRLRQKKDLSQSDWLKQELGDHRIVFNSYLDQNGIPVHNFVTIFHNKGVHMFSIIQNSGEITGKDKDKHWIIHRDKKTFRIPASSSLLEQHIQLTKNKTGIEHIEGVLMFKNDADFSKMKTSWKTAKYSDLLNVLKEGNQDLSLAEIEAYFKKCTEQLKNHKKEGENV